MKKSLVALATLVLAVACAPEFNPFTSGMSGTSTGAATWAEGADFTYFAGTQAQDFTITTGAGSQTAKFSPAGEIATVEEVAGAVAVAPAFANASVSYDGTTAEIVANFPATQKIAALGQYPAGTMVAVASKNTENLSFLPACGILCVKIAGDNVNITKVQFTANGKETINGTAEITVEGGEITDVEMMEDGNNVVTLECGEGLPVSKVAKDFYAFVPAGNYAKGFNVVITASDGAQNTIEGTEAVTVTAGKATQLASVTFAPFVDLNETADPANCYIITKGGCYYFDATIKGNGKAGIYKGFPDQEPTIAPVGAKVIWEEVAGLVTNPFIKEGKLYFSCSGQDGNALVAATDADDNVLWSWHIWSTIAPAEISVLDGRYVFMDRNLGAYSKEDCGFYYEFGRKDPFNGTKDNKVCDPRHCIDSEVITWTNNGQTENIEKTWGVQPAEFHSIAFSIAHPEAYIGTSALTDYNNTWYWLMDSVPGDNYKEYTQWLWGKSWRYYAKGEGSSIEDGNQPYAAFKSIYDPCPAGYMVCTPSALADGGNESGRATHTKAGASLYDGKIILPHSGFLYNVGSHGYDTDTDGDGVNDWVGLMTCSTGWSDENPSGNFRLQCGDGDCRNVYGPAAAHPVRCMKAVFNGDKQTIE
ncbi:MAG: hypothetical protein MJY56_01145 [Bacteroidales bacterium]|nr:hypothetical protein [Bacteroidales bacterium]